MKPLALALTVFLLAGIAHAENCYVSQCHYDEDGTLWCNNYQVSCCDMNCVEYNAEMEQCLPCNFEQTDAASQIDHCQPVSFTRKPKVYRELHYVKEGGIGGFGANGGAFERHTLYSTTFTWPENYSDW